MELLHRPNAVVILASRSDFFDRQYDVLRPALANLVEVLELANWTEQDILDFSRRYAERIDAPLLSAAVLRILSEVPGSQAMLGNPMRLTLLLYLLATGAELDLVNLQEPYSLYDTFYREWIKKERSRGTGGFKPGSIQQAHIVLARWFYENKGEISDYYELMTYLGLPDAQELISDSAFGGLLTLDEGLRSESIIIGFRHETLGEFLIAKDIVSSFGGDSDGLAQALRFTVADDVNTFVRSGVNVASQTAIRRFLANLSERYSELRSVGEETTYPIQRERAERLREQILYYIGRLPLDGFPEILRMAFQDETSPLLRRSAALGAIICGELAIERQYMNMLDDEQEALLNRSVQMVYFGDVKSDLHTFLDAGQDWRKTRSAIYRRLSGHNVRDVRLRWWDLKTLGSFYKSRQYRDAVSDDEAAILERVALDDPQSAERSAAIRNEHRMLMRALGLTS
jgi:hypothetical protein